MTTTPTPERDDGEIEDVAIAISGVFQSGGAGNLAIASAALERTSPQPKDEGRPDTMFDLEAHLTRQREFSLKTFGPGARTHGVVDHIRKELAEIEADPSDIMEWVDVVILAFDGARRAGWEPSEIIKAIVAKQTKNEGRTWPDWRTMREDQAIEHDRTKDDAGSIEACLSDSHP